MKIKVTNVSYEEAVAKTDTHHKGPRRPSPFFKLLIRTLSKGELKDVKFSYTQEGMENLKPDEPCLILMNHSAFIDLSIASEIFKDRPYNIVCTSDGFVGKEWLMRAIGCIPTQKFVTDVNLVKDMVYTVKRLKSSVLLFPEASYSFDGTATPLPSSIGKLVKMMDVPVIMVRTYGAFLRDPLYNNLQKRNTKVSAKVTYLLSREDIAVKSKQEIQDIINSRFVFDNFKLQKESGTEIKENFRADYLNRVLYKCPECLREGTLVGKGIMLSCKSCGKKWELGTDGRLTAEKGETVYPHIPDWYAWERECVKEEIVSNTYKLDIPVDICMMVDRKSIYRVGEGRLLHTKAGFELNGCDGKLHYVQGPKASYSLYSDYYWYEIGDMICIGNGETLYYCFPKESGDVVAKTRLAAEEIYKLARSESKQNKEA